MSERDDAISVDRLALNKELKSDKGFLRREVRLLRQEQKDATKSILELSVENAELKKDVRFFRDTKLIRDYGTVLMAVCGLVGPLFMTSSSWLPLLFYYCVATGTTVAVVLGIGLSRSNGDSQEVIGDR